MDTIQRTTSLWELLNNNGVLIPVFQRDYAQGRAEKRDLRKKFLEEIREGLSSGNGLLLDFVYGAKNNDGKITPLDGQQRLTTIWLLMWYWTFIKYNGIEDNDFKKYLIGNKVELLNKFSYATRPSSSDFIAWLCGDDFFGKNKSGFTYTSKKEYSLSGYIQSLNGFHLSWKQDPTIQSMLRMLSGTYKKDGTSYQDGIEHVFSNFQHPLYQNLVHVGKLFSEDSPIKFYYLDLEGIKQSDKLYVKMNARGEQLSGFENFKADFVAFLSKKENLNRFTDINDNDYILKKWDVDWSDMFWNHINPSSNTGQNGDNNQLLPIDDIFFSFIKRFLLNEYVAEKNKTDKDDEVRALLYDSEQYEYTSFDTYSKLFNEERIEKLIKVLDNSKNIVELISGDKALGLLKSKGYSFFPRYQKEENSKIVLNNNGNPVVSDLSFQERVLMHGICQFLNYHNNDHDSFIHWLRVLTNLVYYDEIASFTEYENRIKFIQELVVKLLGDNSREFPDIYKKISELKSWIEGRTEPQEKNTSQLLQELKKIELILQSKNDLEEPIDPEEPIKELEALWLFEGNIGFVFDYQREREKKGQSSDLNGLKGKLSSLIGTESKKIGDNEKLTKLFQAIIVKWNNAPEQFELLLNNEHNRLRKILNDELKDAFIKVLSEDKNIDNIIGGYNDVDWRYGLVKGTALWKYTDKGKIVKDQNGCFLRKRIYKNEADINLVEYTRFISQNGCVEEISYKGNSQWDCICLNNPKKFFQFKVVEN